MIIFVSKQNWKEREGRSDPDGNAYETEKQKKNGAWLK